VNGGSQNLAFLKPTFMAAKMRLYFQAMLWLFHLFIALLAGDFHKSKISNTE
jgi:hypothetical protein